MNQGGRRPCKFGQNCRQWKNGNCTFLHDNNSFGSNPNPFGGSGFGGRGGRGGDRDRNNYNPDYNTGGGFGGRGGRGGRGDGGNFTNVPYDYNTGGSLGGRGGRGQDSYQQQGGGGGYNQGGNQYNQQNQSNTQDNIAQAFCKFFQLGQCKNENCKRPHQFVKGDLLRRVFRTIDVPKHENSNLRVLTVDNGKYFTLRMGQMITIFQYDSQNGKINEMGSPIVLQYKNLHYYDAKQQYIYFAYENPNTSYTNIGFLNVKTQAKVTIDNAHKLKITGMVHILDNSSQLILMSSSIEGTIKLWRIDGNKLVLNTEATDGFSKCFKNNTNFEVEFLSKQTIQGNQVVAAGTSDNRLLFWIGPSYTYQQIIFPQNYNKVMAIKYVKFGVNWVAIVMAWNATNNMSALIGVNLATMAHEILVQEQANNIKQMFRSIQVAGNLFFVTNVSGLVTIYKVPDFKAKVGCIMHSNSIADVVSNKSYTSTGIELMNLFVLQNVESGRTGSFSVYSLRQ